MQEPSKQQVDLAVDWMKQYQRAKYREKLARAELEQARDGVLRLSHPLQGMPQPTGSHSDRTAQAAERLDLARRACNTAVVRTRMARAAVEQAVAGVEDITLQELLRRRYLLGQTLGQIAREIGMDYRWVRRLHRRAVVRAVPVEVLVPEIQKDKTV